MIGMNIRVLRKKNKMSQELLAERVSVSHASDGSEVGERRGVA